MSSVVPVVRRDSKKRASPSRISTASIADRAMWNCIRSVARMQILEAIRTAGPLSANEVGELLGNQSTGAYYHIRLLQKAGLIASTRNGVNELFTATQEAVRLKCNFKNAKEAQRMSKLVDGLVTESRSSLASSVTATGTSGLLAGWRWEHLEAGEVAQIRNHQHQIAAILNQARARRNRAKKPAQMRANWHVGSFLAPVRDYRFPVSEIVCGDFAL